MGLSAAVKPNARFVGARRYEAARLVRPIARRSARGVAAGGARHDMRRAGVDCGGDMSEDKTEEYVRLARQAARRRTRGVAAYLRRNRHNMRRAGVAWGRYDPLL